MPEVLRAGLVPGANHQKQRVVGRSDDDLWNNFRLVIIVHTVAAMDLIHSSPLPWRTGGFLSGAQLYAWRQTFVCVIACVRLCKCKRVGGTCHMRIA